MSKLNRLISMFFTLIDLFIVPFNVRYVDMLEKLTENCKRILDLGCGRMSPLRSIKKKNMYAVGVDIFEKYIEFSKKEKIHDVYFILNILDIDKKISNKSFDCVLLLDVIEHLEKLDGIKIIRKMQKIARKKIIIFTPNEYLHQNKFDENIYQIHKSSWNLKIFKKMGFKIYGIHGLKFIRGELAKIKLKPFKFWYRVSLFSNFFVKYFPQFAFQLLCVKEL